MAEACLPRNTRCTPCEILQLNMSTTQAAANVEPAVSKNPPPVIKPLETVVISVNDSQSSEYCFRWALEHFIRPTAHKVVLLSIISPPVEAGYYYTAGAAVYTTSYIEELQKKVCPLTWAGLHAMEILPSLVSPTFGLGLF